MKLLIILVMILSITKTIISSETVQQIDLIPTQITVFDDYLKRAHPQLEHIKLKQLQASSFDKMMFVQFATMLNNRLPKELVPKILSYCIHNYPKIVAQLLNRDNYSSCTVNTAFFTPLSHSAVIIPPFVYLPFYDFINTSSRYKQLDLLQKNINKENTNYYIAIGKDTNHIIFTKTKASLLMMQNIKMKNIQEIPNSEEWTDWISCGWFMEKLQYPYIFLNQRWPRSNGFHFMYQIINLEDRKKELSLEEAEILLLKNGLLWPSVSIKRYPSSLIIYQTDPINIIDTARIYIQNNKLICERNGMIELWSVKDYPPQLLKIIDVDFQKNTAYFNYCFCNNILVTQNDNVVTFWDIRDETKLKTWHTAEQLYDFVDNYLIFKNSKTAFYKIYPLALLSVFLSQTPKKGSLNYLTNQL
jgi:hypothetical protein